MSIYELLKFARPVDKGLWESINAITTQSELVDAISKIGISLKIAAHERKLRTTSKIGYKILNSIPYFAKAIQKKHLFKEGSISLQSILISLNRLTSLTTRLGRVYIEKWTMDDEVFKPSNLDNERIITYIEGAIDEIERNAPISKNQKNKLIAYLYKAKSELSESRPSWNKILAALVIAATLLCGIAAAPQAYKNVNNAIQYILGTSIEIPVPPALPTIDNNRIEGYDRLETKEDDTFA